MLLMSLRLECSEWTVCVPVLRKVSYLYGVAKMPFVFSHMEYCDMHFVYGFCNGNARAAIEEYQRCFPDWRIPSRGVFPRINQTLRDTGCLPSVAVQSEREVVRTVQHLEPGDHVQRMELCHWITAHPELLSVILFTDEASFTRDSINNSRNMHTWSHKNLHETLVTNFQRRFSVNVWCGVFGNRLIRPFVFHNNLTGNTYEAFLRNELPGLLEDVLLMVRSQMYFQRDLAPPHYTRHVREYLDESFPNCWLGHGGPVAWAPRSPDLTPMDYYLWGNL
jgi:hypothetical protein